MPDPAVNWVCVINGLAEERFHSSGLSKKKMHDHFLYGFCYCDNNISTTYHRLASALVMVSLRHIIQHRVDRQNRLLLYFLSDQNEFQPYDRLPEKERR